MNKIKMVSISNGCFEKAKNGSIKQIPDNVIINKNNNISHA